jgi:hypothetical protein
MNTVFQTLHLKSKLWQTILGFLICISAIIIGLAMVRPFPTALAQTATKTATKACFNETTGEMVGVNAKGVCDTKGYKVLTFTYDHACLKKTGTNKWTLINLNSKAGCETAEGFKMVALPAAGTTQSGTGTGGGGSSGSYPSTTEPINGDAGGFVPCGNTAGTPCQIGHLFSAFVVIVNYLIAMAGFIAVIAIVFAGFMMIYSQGQEQLKTAKGRLSGAVVGLVLVAAAFVLINALFAGSLSIGVNDGAKVLTSPLEYIKSGGGSSSSSTTPPATTPKSTPPATTPPKTTPPKTK